VGPWEAKRGEARRGDERGGARRLFSTVGDLTMVRGRRWDDAMGRRRGDARVGAFAVDEGETGRDPSCVRVDASLGLPVDRSIDREAWTSRGGGREDGERTGWIGGMRFGGARSMGSVAGARRVAREGGLGRGEDDGWMGLGSRRARRMTMKGD